jgi:alkanesulfonate monooxygenase SsuD/methylene tetrahydromethanopterin reductase-like flavin-dependent oxidoreductase (luciferase family)
MRIGLPGAAASVQDIIARARQAEADGFTSLWFTNNVAGDPLVAMALAGRATTSIELGTAVLQTYPCHPSLQAARAASVASAIGVPGRFTLGVGPSHQPTVEGALGTSYSTPGRHTEEYVRILAPLHVAPLIRAAAAAAGRPEPRIAAGLPVAVHDDVAEARSAAAREYASYGRLPNYQRILARGGLSDPGDAAIIGDEASVTAQVEALFAAGATDVRARPFPVGPEPAASVARTYALLADLARR